MDWLLKIMAQLRDPDHGCPWDIEQDFSTILPFTIEETYEVADAIRQGDMNALKEELGDLLLQVVFLSQIASDKKLFCFEDVVEGISTKLISRHPHIFGTETAKEAEDAEDVKKIWEQQKSREKPALKSGLLADVPLAFPALMRAQKLQKQAAKIGFDWPDCQAVFEKLQEEVAETSQALEEHVQSPSPATLAHLEEEIGDLLFVAVNLARKAGLSAEDTLMKANCKFTNRFNYVEQQYEKNKENSSLEQLEIYWQQAKQQERSSIIAD